MPIDGEAESMERAFWKSTEFGVELAYSESGEGAPVLLIHGFADFSGTWSRMISFLPPTRRWIRIDCAGFGYSRSDDSKHYSCYEQADILAEFIESSNLSELTLIGHGTGGDTALLLIDKPSVRARITSFVLMAASPMEKHPPRYIVDIASISSANSLLKYAHPQLIGRMMLKYAFHRSERLDDALIAEYVDMLRLPGRVVSIVRAAENFKQPVERIQNFRLPTLILRAEEDRTIPVSAFEQLAGHFAPSWIRTIPDSAHFPQLEQPELTAGLIRDFLDGKIPPEVSRAPDGDAVPPQPSSPLRLSRLFDKWNLGSFLVIFILKILQVCRHIGLRAEKHGWRKITGIFLRNEYSKFMLAAFRLSYSSPHGLPSDERSAREILMERFSAFLESREELHWSVEAGLFSFSRKRISYCDLVEAEVSEDGRLLSLTPHFDRRHPGILEFSQEQLDRMLRRIIDTYNELRDEPVSIRTLKIMNALTRRSAWSAVKNRVVGNKCNSMIVRLMSAAFLYFEKLPDDPVRCAEVRVKAPNLRRFRHPGLGMLSTVVRFTSDFSEADFWCQFNHVAVDGAPMQEMLNDLKLRWGTAGNIVYPALTGIASFPKTVHCGDGIFRAGFYLDFSRIMAARAYLNRHCTAAMNGHASVAALILWGISEHEFFRAKKMLVPVDAGETDGNRELGLLVIRPGKFREHAGTRLEAFLNFQREINNRLYGIRSCQSEIHEFMQLCTMLHPMFYKLAKFLAPSSLNEIIGTVGLSIIRDAEMFISPLTDFQINGFMALGSVSVPTANGKKSGAVSVCATRPQIRSYFEAMAYAAENIGAILELPENGDR